MDEKIMIYVYRVIREDLITGQRGKRAKRYSSYSPDLTVGGLYLHLGSGFPGAQRVLDMQEEENGDLEEERNEITITLPRE